MNIIAWLCVALFIPVLAYAAVMRYERDWYKTLYEQSESVGIVNNHWLETKRKEWFWTWKRK